VPIKTIDHNSSEYQQVVQLRYELLRKPLGLVFTMEELAQENNNIHIAAYEEEDLLGTCMLTPVANNEVQLRQMAVKSGLQGKGIGRTIIQFAENIARDNGFTSMQLNARKNVIDFYKKNGYKINSDEFVEVTIPHVKMVKEL
jgi:predicted GNAT family N-acyltransferase